MLRVPCSTAARCFPKQSQQTSRRVQTRSSVTAQVHNRAGRVGCAGRASPISPKMQEISRSETSDQITTMVAINAKRNSVTSASRVACSHA